MASTFVKLLQTPAVSSQTRTPLHTLLVPSVAS